MSVIIVWASPNDDGLTSACRKSAENGIVLAGKDYKSIKLNEFDIKRCKVCEKGYGICNNGNSICCIDDDFSALQKLHIDADAIIIISPVYWQEMSEPAKAFYDRLRRCEAKTEHFKEKKCIVIAAAGGSGNGAVQCLEQMDRIMKNIGMTVYDRLPVTRFSKEYMLESIKFASKKLCESL